MTIYQYQKKLKERERLEKSLEVLGVVFFGLLMGLIFVLWGMGY